MRKCDNCGAPIKKGQTFCENCGNIIDDGNIESFEVDEEVKSDNSQVNDQSNTTDTGENSENKNQQNKRTTQNSFKNLSSDVSKAKIYSVLKIVLWIVFLPIMATITIIKSSNIRKSSKKFYIIAIWIAFLLVYGMINKSGDSKKTSNVSSKSTTKSTTTKKDDTVSLDSIKSLELLNNDVWEKTGTKNRSITVEVKFKGNNYYCGKDVYKYIEFISTNKNVATVEVEKSLGGTVYANITFVGNGKTEIYAQTTDSKILSDKVKFSVGNEFNIEECVEEYIHDYVYDKLRYPEIEREVVDRKYKDRGIVNHDSYKYRTKTDVSVIYTENTNIEGNVATVEGYADTYNANGIECKNEFIIKVKFDKDVLNFTVISEKYSEPSLIRNSLK